MTKYDVVGVGNAIVDVLAKVDDSFLAKHGLQKSGMTLVDEKQSDTLYGDMPPAIEKSGGSAANTAAGIASFGGRAAFIGKVKNDALGKIFGHDLRSIGVHYDTKSAESGPSTARCLISITPDAERTMATFLGATRGITRSDIDESIIIDSKVTYLEGYLWDEPHAKDAMRCAAEFATKHKRKVALSLSDAFCVARHRDDFMELITHGVDILFANEAEIKCLFEDDDFDSCIDKVRSKVEIAAITRGALGSVIVEGYLTEKIAAGKNLKVIDTTGAGDLYASGFLFGYISGFDLKKCGEIATLAASVIIQQIGARPEVSLSGLLKKVA